MNGEFLELYNNLSKDFAVFEAKQKERWKAHTDRAEERKDILDDELKEINVSLKELGKYFDKLPCDANGIKIQNLEDSITSLKNNDIKHLQDALKAIDNTLRRLLFSIIGGALLIIIGLGIKTLFNV